MILIECNIKAIYPKLCTALRIRTVNNEDRSGIETILKACNMAEKCNSNTIMLSADNVSMFADEY